MNCMKRSSAASAGLEGTAVIRNCLGNHPRVAELPDDVAVVRPTRVHERARRSGVTNRHLERKGAAYLGQHDVHESPWLPPDLDVAFSKDGRPGSWRSHATGSAGREVKLSSSRFGSSMSPGA